MTERAPITPAELIAHKGQAVGVSRWFTLDQPLIDAFAAITQDTYFIHTDPVRAKAETPLGGAIAHGFLTLSLLSAMAYDALAPVAGATMGMNYGFDKIRFLSPVPAGARVRARFVVADAAFKSADELVVRYAVTVEIDGADGAPTQKPALAAEWLTIVFFAERLPPRGRAATQAGATPSDGPDEPRTG